MGFGRAALGSRANRCVHRSRALPLGLALAAALAFLSTLAFVSPAAALEQKLTASDGASDAHLGYSVAIDGDTIVIGAPFEGNAGAVYVYQRTGDSWTQTAKLTASDRAGGDYFGYSVAIDGDTIVAGAPRSNVGSNSIHGSIYTFARTGAAARTETAKLSASDGAGDDYLGYSVAIDGDMILAGAPYDDVGSNTDQGSVYTFARTGIATRTETAKLTASDGAGGDNLGYSVAIDGDTIVAGAPYDDVDSAQSAAGLHGSIYTFARTGAAARTETAKLTASDGSGGDNLGTSVAIDGDTIVAGAPYDKIGSKSDPGSVYTFARTGAAARTETAKLTASDGAELDNLGYSVAIDGDTIVAGAPHRGVQFNPGPGSVYSFARTGSATRSQIARVTASGGAANDFLGSSVAVDGSTIVAGAPGDDVGSNENQGSASVFPDFDGDGVPDAVDDCPRGSTGWIPSATTDQDVDGCRDADEDTDDDNDTVNDGADNCQTLPNPGQVNSDNDTLGDACDADDDNDNVADGSDNCPTVANASQANLDNDALGDACDPDRDEDGVPDGSDNCVATPNSGQADFDKDSLGDACDADDDNDQVSDSDDACPTVVGVSPDGCARFATTMDLQYQKLRFRFRGNLVSNDARCRGGRSVTIFRKQDGPDQRYGTAVSAGNGYYELVKQARPGAYYASATAKTIAGVGTCAKARSNTVSP